MKKILIIETEFEGHYLTGYIKYILRSFKNNKMKIILLTSSQAISEGQGALKILRNENVKFIIETLETSKLKSTSSFELLKNQIKLYFQIKKNFNLLKKHYSGFDHIFLTSLQKLNVPLFLFGSPFGKINFTGIFLGSKFHLQNYKMNFKSRSNFLFEIFFKYLLKISTLKYIITNDHLLRNYVRLKKWKFFNKVKFLHDPKEFNFYYSKTNAKKKLGLPKNSIIILVYGALIESKGIMELISIFKTKNLNSNIKICLAGKLLGCMKNFITKNDFIKKIKHKKKLFFYNNWISERLESILFSASDMVWIGYKNYSSPSGVFYQAIQKSLPVIISDDSFIHNLNKKNKFGYSVKISNPESIVEGINFIINKNNNKKIKKNILQFAKISKASKWVSSFKKFIQI